MDPIGWENKFNKQTRLYDVVKPPFEYIFIKLNEKLLTSMFVSVPVGTSKDFILKVQNILNLCEYTQNCKIFELSEDGVLQDICK